MPEFDQNKGSQFAMEFLTMNRCLKSVGSSSLNQVSGVMFESKQEEGRLMLLPLCSWPILAEFRSAFHATIQPMGKRIRIFWVGGKASFERTGSRA
jgi:hypothetical protein